MRRGTLRGMLELSIAVARVERFYNRSGDGMEQFREGFEVIVRGMEQHLSTGRITFYFWAAAFDRCFDKFLESEERMRREMMEE